MTLKAPLQLSFLKEGKHGSDTAACMATAPTAVPALACAHARNPSLQLCCRLLCTPCLGSPEHNLRPAQPLLPFPPPRNAPILGGSPASLSWIETRKCWMQEGLKKVRIKPNSGAMLPLWWGKAQPPQKGACDLSLPINW